MREIERARGSIDTNSEWGRETDRERKGEIYRENKTRPDHLKVDVLALTHFTTQGLQLA